jgi:mRNA interferase MazF
MEQFIKGDIVVIPFPFSNLSGSKKRPALVLADLHGEDIILCQITSRQSKDKFAIELPIDKIEYGSLPVDSYIRPARMFTADKNIIITKARRIQSSIFSKVVSTIIKILEE